MLKAEFQNKAPQGYIEPEEAILEAPATGNAFAGGQYNIERLNALQGAAMNGDDDSSIAAAKTLGSKFKEASSSKKGDKDKGLSMAEMSVLQQSAANLMASMEERQKEIESQLDAIDRARLLISTGQFDENNQNHIDALRQIDPDIDISNFLSKTDEERLAWLAEKEEELKQEDQDLAHDLAALENLIETNPEDLTNALPVTNNRFDSEIMENAALAWEQENGTELDRHNLTEDVFRELDLIVFRQAIENENQNAALSELNQAGNEIAGLINMDFEIKL